MLTSLFGLGINLLLFFTNDEECVTLIHHFLGLWIESAFFENLSTTIGSRFATCPLGESVISILVKRTCCDLLFHLEIIYLLLSLFLLIQNVEINLVLIFLAAIELTSILLDLL